MRPDVWICLALAVDDDASKRGSICLDVCLDLDIYTFSAVCMVWRLVCTFYSWIGHSRQSMDPDQEVQNSIAPRCTYVSQTQQLGGHVTGVCTVAMDHDHDHRMKGIYIAIACNPPYYHYILAFEPVLRTNLHEFKQTNHLLEALVSR